MGELEVPWMMQKYGHGMDRNRQGIEEETDFRILPIKLVVEILPEASVWKYLYLSVYFLSLAFLTTVFAGDNVLLATVLLLSSKQAITECLPSTDTSGKTTTRP